MIAKKVLILSTYPIKNPQHGGQKRTQAIYQGYANRFSEVRHSAIFFRGFYSDYDEDDIPLGKSSELLVMQSPYTGDIISGQAIFNDPIVKKKMTKIIREFKPDIIDIEQPYAYIGLKPLLKELKFHATIVFGSHNIEAPMKREILESVNVPPHIINDTENLLLNLEKDLTKDSDLVIACTKQDLQAHAKMGAKDTVLAPNGIGTIQTNTRSANHWRQIFENLGVSKLILFVGSAHPPNWTGFLDMVGKGLGFVPIYARVVIAGSISDFFTREIKSTNLDIRDATFWLRGYAAGRLSEDMLGALIQQAEVIILPITEGGGSNLKTAEAILANKKVVATSHALRSFEWFADLPNTWIADTQEDFQVGINEALVSPLKPRSSEQELLAQQVTWENSLKEMFEKVTKL